MGLVDSHLHSDVSFDGESSRREMALAAREAGVSFLCFTDHVDLVDEWGNYTPHYDWHPAREAQKEALAAVYGRMELGYGVELGNAPVDFAAAQGILQESGLDFVLASVHNTGRELGYQDYYHLPFRSLDQCHQCFADYLDSIEALVDWGNFDALAHLPYPLRYMAGRDGHPMTLEPYQNRLTGILQALVQKGKALEVNTGKSARIPEEYRWLLQTYRALGGELVTLGTDAHRASDVAKGLREGIRLLQESGFRQLAWYRRRQPCLLELDELGRGVER